MNILLFSIIGCLFGCLSASVFAQTVEDQLSLIPDCASSCMEDGIEASGCDEEDYVCQCRNELTVVGVLGGLTGAATCIMNSCGLPNAQVTWVTFEKLCSIVEVSASTTFTRSTLVPLATQSTTNVLAETSSTQFSQLTTRQSSTLQTSSQAGSTSGNISPASTSTPSPTESRETEQSTPALVQKGSENNGGLNSVSRAVIAVVISSVSLLLVCLIMLLLRKRARQAHSQAPPDISPRDQKFPEHQTNYVLPEPDFGVMTRIEIQRRISVNSTRIDTPDHRPIVPQKDGSSVKDNYSVAEEEFEERTEYLPTIRESLISVSVDGSVRMAAWARDANGNVVPRSPNTFGRPYSSASNGTRTEISDENIPAMPPLPAPSRLPTPETQTLPRRSSSALSLSLPAMFSPRSKSPALPSANVSQEALVLQSADRAFDTGTSSREPVQAPLSPPLGANPFPPGDANHKAANDYFILHRTLSKNKR